MRADAERRGKQVVSEAAARPDRIRAESDHANAAAAQRRDSINSQLASLRQMLSALTPEGDAQPADIDATQKVAAVSTSGRS
jgi:hypothetical protein